MTLKEVASGNQHLRALLAGMSDGDYRERKGDDSLDMQKTPPWGRWLRGGPGWVGGSDVPLLMSHNMLVKSCAGVLRAVKPDSCLGPTLWPFLPCSRKVGQHPPAIVSTSTFWQWVLNWVPGKAPVILVGLEWFWGAGKGQTWQAGRQGTVKNGHRDIKGGFGMRSLKKLVGEIWGPGWGHHGELGKRKGWCLW